MSDQIAQALLVLDAQRGDHQALEDADPRAADARLGIWRRAVTQARAGSVLVVFLQRDGAVGSDHEPLTRGWTLHPDFRVEERDVLLRVDNDDAFAGSPLILELRSRGVSRLSVLALPGSAAEAATQQGAQQAGFAVSRWPKEGQ
ncbi:isochorismatase [Deinococcus detaillensis]|uniref:Isochorismatase n=1 Tax=Deinococcus detaillensis TaxID=2592048 RepID=A0A553V6G3_9DEIO|nr:isochorismatase [Deinococcus detaillensis]TSA88022.1 isochorismatase [Deinococcus detaillensis]